MARGTEVVLLSGGSKLIEQTLLLQVKPLVSDPRHFNQEVTPRDDMQRFQISRD